MAKYVTLSDYVVVRTTDRAIALCKSRDLEGKQTWLPRSTCQDGDALDVGDTDIAVLSFMAEQKDLEY